jgi:hypothetical protein
MAKTLKIASKPRLRSFNCTMVKRYLPCLRRKVIKAKPQLIKVVAQGNLLALIDMGLHPPVLLPQTFKVQMQTISLVPK